MGYNKLEKERRLARQTTEETSEEIWVRLHKKVN